MADGVGAADRVSLAEEVVGEPDLAIGVRAAELLERRACAFADVVAGAAQKAGDVLVALPALQQELQHRALVLSKGHWSRKPSGAASRERK